MQPINVQIPFRIQPLPAPPRPEPAVAVAVLSVDAELDGTVGGSMTARRARVRLPALPERGIAAVPPLATRNARTTGDAQDERTASASHGLAAEIAARHPELKSTSVPKRAGSARSSLEAPRTATGDSPAGATKAAHAPPYSATSSSATPARAHASATPVAPSNASRLAKPRVPAPPTAGSPASAKAPAVPPTASANAPAVPPTSAKAPAVPPPPTTGPRSPEGAPPNPAKPSSAKPVLPAPPKVGSTPPTSASAAASTAAQPSRARAATAERPAPAKPEPKSTRPPTTTPPRPAKSARPAKSPSRRPPPPSRIDRAKSPPPPPPAASPTRNATDLAHAETISDRLRLDPTDLRGILRDRYRIIRKLVSGGQGIVYLAHDERERCDVALKVWNEGERDTRRLKAEFRVAHEIRHPNLVRLHDLYADESPAFFTMELVEGVHFSTYVRHTVSPGRCRADLERLRQATRQLVEGIAVLHENDRVHRDLKPENVLVEGDGRVRILDFGLAMIRRSDDVTLRTCGIEGTPHFMAPEQLRRDAKPIPANDAYAIGVMLYEALTGAMPFNYASLHELLVAKSHERPRPPSALVRGVPPELDALVVRLLDRSPERRATLADILAWCDKNTARSPRPAPKTRLRTRTRSSFKSAALVGRRDPLRALQRAVDRALAGETTFALVQGPGGSGKSALLGHFLAALRERHATAVILEGRVIEHESVPYPAFDRLLEELARFLVGCSEGERAALLAEPLVHLPRIFPILARVPGVSIAEAPTRRADQASRAAAFAELRALLDRLARSRPLILFIDDLHLGDLDSAALLDALLTGADAPPLLVLATARSGAIERSRLFQTLAASHQTIELQPLGEREAITFAATCLGDLAAARPTLARDLARACEGSASLVALLADALCQSPALVGPLAVGGPLTLERILQPLLADFDPLARALLDLLAVEGAPLPLDLLDLASSRKKGFRAALSLLRDASLVDVDEAGRSAEAALVECPQRPIREAVARLLDDDARIALHRALASAHHHSEHGDDERCAHHLLAAGDPEAAANHAANAALIAQNALAFDHAASLYDLALQHAPDNRELRLKLAEVLAAAGEFERSAIHCLRVAFTVEGRRRIELAALACERFFLAGKPARGRRTAIGILGRLGIDWPEIDTRASHLMRSELANLDAHPLEFREQSRCQIGGELLLKIDVCLDLGRLLLASDPLRAAYLAARGAQLALLAGEPRRVAQGLALAGALAAAHDPALAERLLTRGEAIAEHLHDHHGIGLAALCRGLLFLRQGNHFEALGTFALGSSILRERGLEGRWERTTALVGTLSAQAALGEIAALQAAVAAAEADPELAHDPTAAPWIALYGGLCLLARGETDRAETRLCHALRRLAEVDPRLAHAHCTRLAVLVDLYRGLPHKAQSRLWGPDGRGLVGRPGDDDPRLHEGFWPLLEGKVALANALARRPAPDVLAQIEAAASPLAGSVSPALHAEASLLRAGQAHLAGDREAAIRHLRAADQQLLAAGMSTPQLCVQLRLGELISGREGDELRARALRGLGQLGLEAPERWAASVVPS